MAGQNWNYAINNSVAIHRNDYICWRYKRQCKRPMKTPKIVPRNSWKLQPCSRHNLSTRKGRKIIDYIITNIPNEILYSNVVPRPSISDHDASYIIAKITTNKYQSRSKFTGDMKNCDLQKYIDDFKQLLFLIVYSFDNADY